MNESTNFMIFWQFINYKRQQNAAVFSYNFTLPVTIVRQRALQSRSLSLHYISFAYSLVFTPIFTLNNVLLFIIKIL